jgi:hypothetical protein
VTVFGDNPPRALRWANTAGARATTTIVALIALLVSGLLLYQFKSYVGCVAEQGNDDARRTAAIATATDAERRADAALVAGPVPGGPSGSELRRADIDARAHTDAVRAANPPPPPREC